MNQSTAVDDRVSNTEIEVEGGLLYEGGDDI